ncbi:MAG: PilZ domain-containing protein [Myxococcales bacterium]|jgi:hypothetical protein|nr:PilZ domain-containing protein [Myxococcales bacterium]
MRMNRRSFRRFVRLDCQVVRERDLATIGDLALDLSTDGMLVRGTQRVLTGEEVIVSFRPPRSNRLIDAMGTVARVIHARRPTDRQGFSVGVEFEWLNDEDRDYLFERLRGLEPAPPSRPLRALV